ncbi:LamG-like jellyroll fold domain-containing protein [Verrucomicrobiaceae bacterium 227]
MTSFPTFRSLCLFSLTATLPASAGLLAAWEFNPADVSGTSITASGGSASNTTGQLIDNAIIDSGTLLLDGDGDYLQFGDNLTDLRSLDTMTIAFWFQATVDPTPTARIIEHEDNFYLYHDGNTFRYTTHGTPGSGGAAVAITPPVQNQWQHITLICSSDEPAEIYINGVLEGTSPGNQVAMPNNTQTFQIGARRSSSGGPSAFLTGILDDVAIWDEKLSAGDIASLAGSNASGYLGRAAPTELDTDCNDDGIPDTWYQRYDLDPCSTTIGDEDSDLDTLTNAEEFALNTDPTKKDTDGDGIDDNEEINTDPNKADTDGDGLNDKDERDLYFTDPNKVDSDDDTLSDGDEVLVHTTDPNKADTDEDTFSDSIEINSGTDPKNELEFPTVDTTGGLIVYHSFDADGLNAEIFSDSAGSATPIHATQNNGGPQTTIGLFGEAANFLGGSNNSDSEYADLSSGAATLGALNQGSISTWVKIPSSGLQTDVLTIFALSDADDGSSEARLFVSNGGSFGTGSLAYGGRNDGEALGNVSSGGTGPLLDDEWHHVALSYDDQSGEASLFIDGILLERSSSGFFDEILDANSAAIGRNKDTTAGGGQWFFQGAMDDFAIWDRPLNAAEVDRIYQQGLQGTSLLQGGSNLTITAIERDPSNGHISITWNSIPGRNYALQYSTTLQAQWSDIDDLTAEGATTTIIDTFANSGKPKGFYRIVQLP